MFAQMVKSLWRPLGVEAKFNIVGRWKYYFVGIFAH